jgi:hypothetical protein
LRLLINNNELVNNQGLANLMSTSQEVCEAVVAVLDQRRLVLEVRQHVG